MKNQFTKSGYYMLCNGKIVKLSKHNILPYLTGKEGNWLIKDGKRLGVNREWDLAEYLGKRNPLKDILGNKAILYLLEKAFDAGKWHFRNKENPDFDQFLAKERDI